MRIPLFTAPGERVMRPDLGWEKGARRCSAIEP